MTFRSISSSDLFTFEEREELRFLRSLKGVLQEDVANAQQESGQTQAQLAQSLGVDPAQLSRALSPDRHNSTATLFTIMHRLGRRWSFGSAPTPTRTGGNRVPGPHDSAPNVASVVPKSSEANLWLAPCQTPAASGAMTLIAE
jgi:transcriptional regulator with XRE-family HTH domain